MFRCIYEYVCVLNITMSCDGMQLKRAIIKRYVEVEKVRRGYYMFIELCKVMLNERYQATEKKPGTFIYRDNLFCSSMCFFLFLFIILLLLLLRLFLFFLSLSPYSFVFHITFLTHLVTIANTHVASIFVHCIKCKYSS